MMFNSITRNVLVDTEACKADPKKCTFELRGELAESWQRPDPLTYVFKLRQGAKFHDGSPWNAEAAKWNLERLANHPKSTGKETVAPIKSIDIVDTYTLKLNLKSPSAIIPAQLSSAGSQGRSRIISKAAVEKLGDDEFGRNAVGAGPFKLKEWKPDDRVVLERFDSYWEMGEDGKPLPYLDGALIRYITDTGVQAIELRSGNVDMIFEEMPQPQDLQILKSDPNLVYWEWLFTSNRLYFIINAQDAANPVLSQDLSLRQSIAYGIDRQGLVKSLGLGFFGYPAYYVWAPGMPGYDDTLPHYDYNPEKAKQLLGQSKYAGQQFDFLIYTTDGRKFGEVVQQMLGSIGIKLGLTALERLAWVDKTRAHNFDTAELGQGVPPDNSVQARNLYTGSLGNYEGQQNQEMDKCMDEGGNTDDPKVRHQAYRRCEQIVYEMAYRIPVYTRPSGNIARKYVKGITTDGMTAYPNFLWLDK